MQFNSVDIHNLRCLQDIQFVPDAGTSLIVGANGSGKTSVLEALALASLGKSFLSNRSSDIVRSGAQGLSVRAMLSDPDSGPFDVSVRKIKGETSISLDGMPIMAASALAQRVPLVVINSKAADILGENPSNRRALVDRTMFHVEPAYVKSWKGYRQALRQRNELLKNKAPRSETGFWHDTLAELAEAIDEKRLRVVSTMNKALESCPLGEILGPLRMNYAPGWNRGKSYREQLDESWGRDLKFGHTSLGIHRADLTLKADERSIARRLSRGQAKFIVCNLLLSLADFVKAESAKASIILVDDLAAELDDKMRAGAVEMVNQRGGQRIFTAIKASEIPEISDVTNKVFHVEQANQVVTA